MSAVGKLNQCAVRDAEEEISYRTGRLKYTLPPDLAIANENLLQDILHHRNKRQITTRAKIFKIESEIEEQNQALIILQKAADELNDGEKLRETLDEISVQQVESDNRSRIDVYTRNKNAMKNLKQIVAKYPEYN